MNDTLLWYTTRGAGVVTLLMLTGVAVLGVLTSLRVSPGGWPRFMVGGLHRNLALLAVSFLGERCTAHLGATNERVHL